MAAEILEKVSRSDAMAGKPSAERDADRGASRSVRLRRHSRTLDQRRAPAKAYCNPSGDPILNKIVSGNARGPRAQRRALGVTVTTAIVLTYHRIVPDGERRLFHDVEIGAFVRQVRRVVERTAKAVDGSRVMPASRYVHFTFDDGTGDHRRAAEVLSRHDVCGTFFIITGRLGRAGYLTEDDVIGMAAEGHRIASHTVTHRHLTSLPPSELLEELNVSRLRLEQLIERKADWLAAPGGICSTAVVETALRAGYRVVRTMDWGYARMPLHGEVPCLPVFARYDIGMFDRLLDGRAPLWLHWAKDLVKRGAGPGLYTTLRNLGDRLLP